MSSPTRGSLTGGLTYAVPLGLLLSGERGPELLLMETGTSLCKRLRGLLIEATVANPTFSYKTEKHGISCFPIWLLRRSLEEGVYSLTPHQGLLPCRTSGE